ncbi:MAG TPA: MOSC N-terminal beta barrel domain-containing protein [Mycobacteriales bacterium]|nr:MOSC N-terminal beta barrel domain-containing protein [Mycobacteriales bacterium]
MSASVVGQVAQLWRHSVKSLQGEALVNTDVGEHGLVGDRMYGVRDGLTGRVMSAKREPRLLQASARYAGGALLIELPGGETHAVEDPALAVAMTEWLGRPVVVVAASMVRPSHDPFMDASPVHVLTDGSLRALARQHPAGDWAPRRFRANVIVEVEGSGFVEDGWLERRLAVGDVELSVGVRTVRCPMTSMPQPGLADDPAILATTAQATNKRLGVYADVVTPGHITVGDPVRLL